MALIPQVVKTYAFLLAVEVNNGSKVVRVLALIATGAEALGKVKADLSFAATLLARPGIILAAVGWSDALALQIALQEAAFQAVVRKGA